MRTSVFLALFSSLGLFCVTRAADIPLSNSSSSVHLVETRHFHLGNDEAKESHGNETYVTEDPHKHHGKHSTVEAKLETPNIEHDVTDFFTAYEETKKRTQDERRMRMLSDPDKEKLLKSNNMEDHSMTNIQPGHVMEDHSNHDGHVMEDHSNHDGHVMEDHSNHDGHVMDDHSNHDGHVMEDHSRHAGHVMVKDHDMDDHDTHDDHDHHMKMDKNGTGSMMHDMMMMMYFHAGVKETVLFKQWKITTVGGLIGSMIGIFLLAVIYEGLKYFREHLFKKYVSSIQFSTVAVTGESGRVTQVHKLERHQMMSFSHAVQTALHVIQIVLSYFLMLIFMTYNVWLCLALVLGAGFGYFIFGWKKATVVDITEHCH